MVTLLTLLYEMNTLISSHSSVHIRWIKDSKFPQGVCERCVFVEYLMRGLSAVTVKLMNMSKHENFGCRRAHLSFYDCVLLQASQNEKASKDVD